MNNNITEDYCSFEVSKLLKEKGFDNLSCECFDINGKSYQTYQEAPNSNKELSEGGCISPTHALAIMDKGKFWNSYTNRNS